MLHLHLVQVVRGRDDVDLGLQSGLVDRPSPEYTADAAGGDLALVPPVECLVEGEAEQFLVRDNYVFDVELPRQVTRVRDRFLSVAPDALIDGESDELKVRIPVQPVEDLQEGEAVLPP